MLTFGNVAAAQAMYSPPEYCSPSIGCIGQYGGKNVYAPSDVNLTATEQALLLECNVKVLGELTGGISRSFVKIVSAIRSAADAASGPCVELWNSTTRYR